jgi:hypothetical protein
LLVNFCQLPLPAGSPRGTLPVTTLARDGKEASAMDRTAGFSSSAWDRL